MKKGIKILSIATGAAACLILAAALAVPPLAERYVEKHGKELVGRTIAIEKLRFNIFNGKLRIRDIRMLEADDTTTFASIGEFYLRMKLWPLLRHRIVVREIRIERPDVNIYQRGPHFNFDDLLLRFLPDTTQTTNPAEPSEPWEVGIDDIEIAKGHIYYKDLRIGADWGFENLDVTVPGIYFKDKTDVGVLFNFVQGGSLALKLNYDMDNADYDLRVDLRELALNGRLPYVQQTLNAGELNGLFSADLQLNGNLQNLMDLSFAGSIDLARFSLRDVREEEVVKVDSLHVGLKEGSLRRNRFHFDRLYLLGMEGRFDIYKDGTNNIAALLKEQPAVPTEPGVVAEAPASASASAEPASVADRPSVAQTANAAAVAQAAEALDVRIEDIEIARGAVHITDRSRIRPFEYRLTDIRMKSSFDMNRMNRIVIDARVQKTGRAKIRWEGSLSDLDNQNILVNLSNIDLKDFSPYCEHFTAYPLTHGNFSFRSQNIIADRRIRGTNHLDMFEPKVDKKRKDVEPAFKIPLKLGLYVLKDKKGHVKIDLPVEGSIDDPDFSYRRIVTKALGNVLLKVVTAPFSFLSENGDNLEYIPIEPLQQEFTPEQYATLDRLAEMLRDKPEMKVTLTQRIEYARALDRQARNNLKMEYYNAARRQVDTTTAYRPLTMLDYERVRSLNFKSDAVMRFADSLLRLRGEDPSRLDAEQKARALYADRAAGQLTTILARRNEALARYLRDMQGIPAASFSVATLQDEALKAYIGKNRYTIGIEVDGETAEVAANPAEASDTAMQTGLPAETSATDRKASNGAFAEPVETSATDRQVSDGASSTFAAPVETSATDRQVSDGVSVTSAAPVQASGKST